MPGLRRFTFLLRAPLFLHGASAALAPTNKPFLLWPVLREGH